MNAHRHLRIATIASIFLFLVIAGFALFAGTTTSIAARGNTGKALEFQSILATNKAKLFNTSPFVPAGRQRNTSDGRFILDRSFLQPHAVPAVPPVQGPVQTFDTLAPPPSFSPYTNPAGVTEKRVATNVTPVWSADETYILFSSNRMAATAASDASVAPDGRYHIWAISANGGQAIQVTSSVAQANENPAVPHGEFFPALDPSNSQLAFTSDARSVNIQALYVIPFQLGQNVTDVATLTTPVNSKTVRSDNLSVDFDDVRRPTWGGAGQLAFSARTTSGAYAGHYHIYFMYSASLGFNQFASSNNPPAKLTNGPADDNNPAWAPDGTYIAFDSTASALNSNGVISGDFNASPVLTTASGASPALRSIFLITNTGAIVGTQGRLTVAGTDDITPAWSFSNSNPYSNPRGDTEYIAFSRGLAPNGAHDIYFLKVISKQLSGGESGPSNLAIAQSVPSGTPVYQLDAGSNTAVPPYAADDQSTGITVNAGSVNTFPAGATVNTANVINPAPAQVYLSYHTATGNAPNFTYTIPNLGPNGAYLVRLHFAEPTATAVGQRVFNVTANGVPALTNYDIFAQAGAQNVAAVDDLPVFADATGNIALTFSSVTGNAIVNGVEVISTGTGRSITQGTSAPGAPLNVTAVPFSSVPPFIQVTWNGVANAVSYNVYRSSSAAPNQGFVLYQGGILATSGIANVFTFDDTRVTAKVTYTYFVTTVTSSQATTIVTPEGSNQAKRVNTETVPGGYNNIYPAWSPFSRIFSIVYQSNRSITYTNPANGQPSETEISLPQGSSQSAIGTYYQGLLQSQVVNVDPPTLQRFNANEIVHVNVGAAAVMPSGSDETGSATHLIQQNNRVWFTVRLSDREAGIDNTGGPNGGPNVYVQIKDPDSKYQDDQGLEHKVFAHDPRLVLGVNPGTGSANSLLYNGFGLGNRPVNYDDQHGRQVFPDGDRYQRGVIAGTDAGIPLSIGVNLGPDTWLPPTATDPVKGILRGGDPNNFISYGPEYECQYINPTVAAPATTLGDYGDPFFLAGYDDRTPFTGDDRAATSSTTNTAPGAPRPNTEWLQLNVAPTAMQDHKGGVLYTGFWNVPGNTVSDYYLDVIAYNQATYPFDNSVNLGNYTKGDWRIYDNVWGMSSKGFGADNDLLVVSDNMLGQKFVATSFGGDRSFLSSLLPVFYGAESYVTDIDSSLLPNVGYYWVAENGTEEVYLVPIYQTVPFGTYIDGFPPVTPVRNGLGVNSYIDSVIDNGSRTLGNGNTTSYTDVPSQRYSIWRTLCRGPLDRDTLKFYNSTVTSDQPAVKDTTLGIDIPHAQVPASTKAVLWFSPFAGDLFTGPGTITDANTQAMLTDFVNGGGRLMVSGQDVFSSNPNSDFVKNTLHVASSAASAGYQVTAGAKNILGAANTFISNDFRYDPKWRTDASLDQLGPTATAYYGGVNQSLQYLLGQIDGVTPINGGVSDLVFNGGNASGLTYYENPDPAVGSRVVFASFGLEGLGQELTRVNDTGAAPRNFHLETLNNRSITIHNIVSYLRTGTFTGTVVDQSAGGASVDGVLVYAVPDGGQLGVRKAYSGMVTNGVYTIGGIPPGSYTIYAIKDGYQLSVSSGHLIEGDVTVIVGLKISQLLPTHVIGTVKDFFTHQPISGATIVFTSTDGVYSLNAQSGADGVYTIDLPSSAAGLNYTAVASKVPVYGPTAPQAITAIPGATVDGTSATASAAALLANFLLKPVPGTVHGRIFDTTNGASIGGATVTLSLTGNTLQTVTTATDGTYSIDVGGGTYTVTATKSGYDTKSITVTVVAKQTTSGQDIGLTPIPPGFVGGLVFNTATGQPVAGVTVTILTADYKSTVKVFTTSGSVTSPAAPGGDGKPLNYVGSLPEGTYGVSVRDANLGVAGPTDPTISAAQTFTVTRGQFTRVDLSFNLGTLGGLVTGGPSSPPLAGVTVTVTNSAGATVATTTTGATSSPGAPTGNGSPLNYQVFLAAGTYTVTFSKNGYITSTPASVTINTGAFTRLDSVFAVVWTYPSGLQMISSPYDYSNFALDALFGPDRSKLVIWQPQLLQYVVDPTPPADNLHLGYGYWIKLPHAVDIAVKGTPPSTGTVGVPLHAFWNQIGVPNTRAINLSELQFLNPLTPGSTLSFADASSIKYNLVGPIVYGYDQGSNKYVPVTSLQPWHGYWIKVTNDTTVYMPTTNP